MGLQVRLQGGAGARGAEQGEARGFDVDGACDVFEIDVSNTVEAQRGYAGIGIENVVVRGLRQATPTTFSNLGQVVVRGAATATVQDNVLRGVAGAPGDPPVHGALNRPAPGSACVDRGDPDAPCGDEPVSDDDSCRLDMGHLAGTADARSR